MCFGCSKNRLIDDVYFEYPQHMFWLRIFFQLHTLSYLGPAVFYFAKINHIKIYLVVTCKVTFGFKYTE